MDYVDSQSLDSCDAKLFESVTDLSPESPEQLQQCTSTTSPVSSESQQILPVPIVSALDHYCLQLLIIMR